MVRAFVSAMFMIALAILFVTTGTAAEPAVKETLEDGQSMIRIASADGAEAVYRIDLSERHSPASEQTALLKRWESHRLSAFVCFNTNQFSGIEICKADDPQIYAPQQLDVAGWVAAFKAAGMRYAVLTTRHTSGFLLWDSATTEFDVASSGNTTDVCREFVAECRKQGLVPAFYYCLWGGKWNPDPNARAIVLAQLHELATQYDEIPYFWLDMMNWAPPNLSTQEIYDALKSLQPNAVVMFNQHVQDGTKINYFPTDVVNGELVPPPTAGHDPFRTVDGKTYYLPFEYSLVSQSREGGYKYDPLGPSCWFTYGEGKNFTPSQPFAAEALAKQIRFGWKQGAANVLLATAPDHSGRMRPEDVEQLRRLGEILRGEEKGCSGLFSERCRATASSVWEDSPEWGPDKALDGDPETRWGAGVGMKQGWLEIDLGDEKRFDTVTIQEGWGRIRRFDLQANESGEWRTLLEGTAVGPHFVRKFAPTSARYIRLNIHEANDVPTIWEFQLFDCSEVPR
jgi:alpha-L-fucosidase